MSVICEFSVGFDNEIEDITMYNNLDSKKTYTQFIETLINQKTLIVGERCEGVISIPNVDPWNQVNISYRWCSEVGEDWEYDVWNEEVLTLVRDDYEI